MNEFFTWVDRLQRERGSVLCIGLDPDPDRIEGDIADYLATVIEQTRDVVCCYKPNLAFFESTGLDGWRLLDRVLEPIRGEIPVIADAKRGDVGHTSTANARAIFDVLGCDAVTLSPYAGFDTVVPFAEYPGRGVFVLCRMSNASAGQLQDRALDTGDRLFTFVAELTSAANSAGNLGLVMGATAPEALRMIQRLHPDLPLLIPGIGPQGGEAEVVRQVVAAGRVPTIVNASRGILYGEGGAGGARERALRFNEQFPVV
jgi:orotidine-5'-phosphate decarboxylase